MQRRSDAFALGGQSFLSREDLLYKMSTCQIPPRLYKAWSQWLIPLSGDIGRVTPEESRKSVERSPDQVVDGAGPQI